MAADFIYYRFIYIYIYIDLHAIYIYVCVVCIMYRYIYLLYTRLCISMKRARQSEDRLACLLKLWRSTLARLRYLCAG